MFVVPMRISSSTGAGQEGQGLEVRMAGQAVDVREAAYGDLQAAQSRRAVRSGDLGDLPGIA
jgi:hypothetical protein